MGTLLSYLTHQSVEPNDLQTITGSSEGDKENRIDSMPDTNHSGEQAVEWVYRLLVIGATVAVAYFQIQTSLAIAQLELKIERQRVEDIRTRPDNRDIERIEKQIQEIRESLRGNSNAK